MNEVTVASALPTKRFFIQMLTRDIALEDALLDLIDNSIDSFGRSRHIDFTTDLLGFSNSRPRKQPAKTSFPTIELELSAKEFRISDNCGGISFESARTEVFRIGRTIESAEASLGVYGIGLKRALFKIGKSVSITSRARSNGFNMKLDVAKWEKDDSSWDIPITKIDGKKKLEEAGTSIVVTQLNPEIVMRLGDGSFMRRLADMIATTYSLFIQKYVAIVLNGEPIEPKPIPIANSEEITPAVERLDIDTVSVTLVAGLAERRNGEWSAENAGWYVLCNGRVVVSADKTELTGWGLPGARFVSKYRGFIGIAFFFSKNPQALPWTTTKRGLNLDSPSFQRARARMTVVGRPVLNFLNRMYSSEAPEEIEERTLADKVRAVDVRALALSNQRPFEVRAKERKTPPSMVNVQFKAEWAEIEKAKKCLRKSGWSAGRVARYAFEYFLEQECPE